MDQPKTIAEAVMRRADDPTTGLIAGGLRLTHAEVNVWRRPLQQPGAENALWSIARNGIPSLSGVQLAALRASPIPKSVVFGLHDPQYSRAAPSQVAARIAAPPPTIVPGAHLTMIASPHLVAAAIRTLCNRAAVATG